MSGRRYFSWLGAGMVTLLTISAGIIASGAALPRAPTTTAMGLKRSALTRFPEGSSRQPAPKAPARLSFGARKRNLLLLFSGQDLGYLDPCGCSSPQLGGLSRRGSLFLERPDALALDNGDWVNGADRQQQLKAEATARFVHQFHYTAVNPGEQDYALGYPQLTLLQQRAGVPFLSTNVNLQGGQPAFTRSIVINRGRRRIALFGLLSPSFADTVTLVNPVLSVEDPARAIATAWLQAHADIAIVLYHGPATEARTLVNHFPWISLVITAHDGEDPHTVPGLRGVPIISPGERARAVGRALLPLTQNEPAKALPAIFLGPMFPDARAVARILADYQRAIVAEDLLSKTPRAPLEGNWFAGSASCASCHVKAYRVWAKSLHARAYRDLIRAGHSRDPDCVGCHVVGLNSVGGFVSWERTPALAEVGCESCHGPQGLHTFGRGPKPAKLSLQMCVTCHTPDQSPRFNLKAYWPRITH